MFTPTNLRRSIAVAGVAVLAAGPLAACGSDDDASSDTSTTAADAGQEGASGVEVGDPWARPGTAGGNSAIYMELTGGAEDDAIVGAAVPADVATDAQVHETVTADGGDDGSTETTMGDMGDDTEGGSEDNMDGMMTMQEVESVPVVSGETVTFEPGGFHVMLLDLQKDLVVGDTVEVTLSLESGAEQTVTAEVREP